MQMIILTDGTQLKQILKSYGLLILLTAQHNVKKYRNLMLFLS